MGSGNTVLVADDDASLRALLEAVLGRSGDFEVVASVPDADGAGSAAAEHQPALALVDVSMPGGGPAAARAIRAASPRTRVIALSSHDDARTVRTMLSAGAVSYVVKGTPPAELLDVMRGVLAPSAPAPSRVNGPPQRVLIAHSDPLVLDELAESTMASPELELVGLAQTPYHALSLAAQLRPDIAVVDEMTSGGARVGVAMVAASPHTEVVPWVPGASVRDLARQSATPAIPIVRLPERRRFERLAAVLAGDRLDIQLQPIVGLADSRPRGYEALARFPNHPHPGPDVWFAEAHRADVGVQLERFAVRSALLELEGLPADTFLALNVSPDTAVHPGLRDDLAASDPTRIVIELTEHVPVRDYDNLERGLDALRALGTRVAVDDCGAGFTSLRHVALIAPDFLKLDMILCRDVREPARAALARALVSFARETGSTVIAEGIEAADDLAALRDLGVELGQGYLFSRPETPLELLAS
jgi:EAL domain-containing protein (putative c-di-GMP-specific phosphodiesterase class I)/DNA-binding NarL/FixJ family response regulator